MKLNIELYLKVDFQGTGVGLEKAYTRNGKRNTYGYSRLLVVQGASWRTAAAAARERVKRRTTQKMKIKMLVLKNGMSYNRCQQCYSK